MISSPLTYPCFIPTLPLPLPLPLSTLLGKTCSGVVLNNWLIDKNRSESFTIRMLQLQLS